MEKFKYHYLYRSTMNGATLIALGLFLIGASIVLGAVGKALVDAGQECLYNEVYQRVRC